MTKASTLAIAQKRFVKEQASIREKRQLTKNYEIYKIDKNVQKIEVKKTNNLEFSKGIKTINFNNFTAFKKIDSEDLTPETPITNRLMYSRYT